MEFEVTKLAGASADLATVVQLEHQRAVRSRIDRLSIDRRGEVLADSLGTMSVVEAVNGRYRITIMVKTSAQKVIVVGISLNPRSRP